MMVGDHYTLLVLVITGSDLGTKTSGGSKPRVGNEWVEGITNPRDIVCNHQFSIAKICVNSDPMAGNAVWYRATAGLIPELALIPEFSFPSATESLTLQINFRISNGF